MTLTFLKLAEIVLIEVKKPLTYSEIWKYAEENKYVEQLNSQGKTPLASLSARLSVEIRDNPSTIFTTHGERPRKYGLKNFESFKLNNDQCNDRDHDQISAPLYSELDLHSLLAYYGYNFLKINLITIKHNKSEKRQFGEWVHPDMVGCYFPFSDWGTEVVDISTIAGNAAVRFYSFELKKELSFGNLRESFFQAVSNSSWPNEGYLVAAVIDDDPEFREELRRLSAAFGIGVIKLDTEDPDSSSIIFPARYNEQIDWDTVNKLSAMNSDFKSFLKRVKNDLNTKEIRKEQYEKVMSRDDLIKKFKLS